MCNPILPILISARSFPYQAHWVARVHHHSTILFRSGGDEDYGTRGTPFSASYMSTSMFLTHPNRRRMMNGVRRGRDHFAVSRPFTCSLREAGFIGSCNIIPTERGTTVTTQSAMRGTASRLHMQATYIETNTSNEEDSEAAVMAMFLSTSTSRSIRPVGKRG